MQNQTQVSKPKYIHLIYVTLIRSGMLGWDDVMAQDLPYVEAAYNELYAEKLEA